MFCVSFKNNMSGRYLNNFTPNLKEAIQELQKIQRTRKYKMAVRELGKGPAVWKDAEDQTTGECRGRILLRHRNGISELWIGPSCIPCNNITNWSFTGNVATFHLKDFPDATKVILSVNMETIQNIMAYVNLSPPPRPMTYEHDGNITSSSSDSNDSANGRTTGSPENSYESDEPSEPSTPESF